MIVEVHQAGGLAGSDPVLLGRVDTSTLAPDTADHIRALVEQIETPSEAGEPVGADMFEYRIDVRPDDGPEHTVVVTAEEGLGPNGPRLDAVQALLETIGNMG